MAGLSPAAIVSRQWDSLVWHTACSTPDDALQWGSVSVSQCLFLQDAPLVCRDCCIALEIYETRVVNSRGLLVSAQDGSLSLQ